MLEEYLCLGGVEIANNARVYGHTSSSTCSLQWFKCEPCDTIHDATNDWVPATYRLVDGSDGPVTELVSLGYSAAEPYSLDNIQDAPWYDADIEKSARFYGVFIISIEGIDSSTRTATVTEGVLDGGVVSLVRHGTREIVVRALLVADGDDALEYGRAWLDTALTTNMCSTHGAGCGSVDLTFFGYCPPSLDEFNEEVEGSPTPIIPDELAWQDAVEDAVRYLHGVTTTSGPTVDQKLKSNDGHHLAEIVEFVLVAGTPWMYGTTNEVELDDSLPVMVQDAPFNLVPYPSAELALGTVIVNKNYSTNPSLETDIAGWIAGAGTVITATKVTARDTTLSASGVASFRQTATATNSGTAGLLYNIHEVTLPAYVAGTRYSITAWIAATRTGTAVLGSTELRAEWLDGGGATLRVDVIGTGAASGGAIGRSGLSRPPTATKVKLVMIVNLTSWSTGAVINLFSDAVAVTLP